MRHIKKKKKTRPWPSSSTHPISKRIERGRGRVRGATLRGAVKAPVVVRLATVRGPRLVCPSRSIRSEVFFLQAQHLGERGRAFAGQHSVFRVLHNKMATGGGQGGRCYSATNVQKLRVRAPYYVIRCTRIILYKTLPCLVGEKKTLLANAVRCVSL